MYVIGTAGHVDHGKSTLVKALTGIHPDRLKEEILREMTIELGFAWLTLPGKEEIGIIDVPGHRDFIENMLAGVGGIDAALLVIAADEGVMPQTKEHLAILDLLQIKNGIIVLSKIDLVDDPDWLDLIELDIREVVSGTILSDAPIIKVSAHTKAGINDLITAIQSELSHVQPKPDHNRARLSIDRVFTLSGFGTIVTGTLIDGTLKIGQELELLPEGEKVRIRGLQTHKKKEEIVYPGSRTAVNITGIELDQVHRGQVLTAVGKYQPTKRFDAHINLIVDAHFSIKHNQEIKLFIGSSEVTSRVRVLGKDEILPGEEGWVQIEPVTPVVGIRGDRFIIRIPSPGETIGGGLIVNPNPRRRHKRFSTSIIKQLEAYLKGTPQDIFLQAVQDDGVGTLEYFSKKAKLDITTIYEFLPILLKEEQIISLDKGNIQAKPIARICSGDWFNAQKNKTTQLLGNYHQLFKMRPGMPKEELKSKLGLDQGIFLSVLELFINLRIVELSDNFVKLSGFKATIDQVQTKLINQILNSFRDNPYSTPGLKELTESYGIELINYLQSENIIIAVNSDVAFLSENYNEMVEWVNKKIDTSGALSLAEFRDQFNTSRKYGLAFLEYLDKIGMTIREGDIRKLRPSHRRF
ncbi:MAG TPA: selenocysteine-specific translation elongation factor [Anaerolineaceae bacterium]|nr:selenocysteine-specific translation elongation factor [Anaerolineaceae bacterium]